MDSHPMSFRKEFRKEVARKEAVSGSASGSPPGNARVSFRKPFRKSGGRISRPAEAVEVGAAAPGDLVALLQADGEAEVLELPHVDLERLRLPSHRCSQVRGAHA